MNKYYVPDITEFHIGLEYEVKDIFKRDYDNEVTCSKDFLGKLISCYPGDFWLMDNGWKKEKFGSYSTISNYIDWAFKEEMLEPIISGLRVKYLDREDIENLGFKYNANYADLPELGFIKETDNKTQYLLFYNTENNTLRIERIFDCGTGKEDYLFNGIIKNKSELKVLLKQLKISE